MTDKQTYRLLFPQTQLLYYSSKQYVPNSLQGAEYSHDQWRYSVRCVW